MFTCNCGGGCDDYPIFYDSDDSDDYPSAIKVLFYPQVMGYSCLAWVSKIFLCEFSSTSDPSCWLESSRSERKQWHGSGLFLLTIAGRTARHIIQLAGLGPDLATSAEMDQLELRFSAAHVPWSLQRAKKMMVTTARTTATTTIPYFLFLTGEERWVDISLMLHTDYPSNQQASK